MSSEGPKLRFTLAQRGLLYLLIPLVVQVGIITWLVNFVSQLELETAKAQRARQITDNVNKIVKDLLDIERVTNFEAGPMEPAYFTVRADLHDALATLHDASLATGDKQLIDAVEETIDLQAQATQTLEEGHKQSPADWTFKQLNRRYRNLKQRAFLCLYERLVPMARLQNQAAEELPKRDLSARHQIKEALLALLWTTIALTALSAWMFNKTIMRKLRVIYENCVLYASGKPLHPLGKGNDELAELEKAFHVMAKELTEMAHKERALVTNAIDVICSLDERFTFVEVNPACLQLFGYTQSELIGTRLVSLLLPEDEDLVFENLTKSTKDSSKPVFESRVKRKDGLVVSVSWSVRWSPDEKSLFCVIHNITDRREAERMKQEVVEMVSHDLRTPLSTIDAFLNLLSTGNLGSLNEKGASLLTMAERSSHSMMTLVRDLLECEKLNSGTLQLDKAHLSLANVFQQTDALITGKAQECRIRVLFVDNGLKIYADMDRLVQILTNLTTNALKFSPQDSTVRIEATESNGFTEISVTDQGRGIPEAHRTAIFDRFRQLRSSDSKQHGGSGLGLAICKALIELHNGSIEVVSVEGQGATFIVRIPLDKSVRQSAQFGSAL